MHPLKNWKLWTITGSATLGSIYGLVAIVSLRAADTTLWDLIISAVAGAALCGSAGSALCRMIETYRLIRESQKRPTDHSLCYRGIRY